MRCLFALMAKVLSLGRNCIKKIEGLEPVAGTLQQLWISYNAIEKLVSVAILEELVRAPLCCRCDMCVCHGPSLFNCIVRR